jgi:hypothetical protein
MKSAVAAPGNKENENEVTTDDSDVEMGDGPSPKSPAADVEKF